jgi:hypothetical protein
MMAPVYCEQCEQMTHPTFPHSCFSAATLRAHKDAEQAVIAAAKVMADFLVEPSQTDSYNEYLDAKAGLLKTVDALRALEADA